MLPSNRKLFSKWRLSKRSTVLRRCGPAHCVEEPSPVSSRTGANRATRDLMATHMHTSVAILAQVGIQQAPGLSCRCICHLGNPIKTRFESGFCLRCTSHGPCRLSSYHQVWEIWLHWILSGLCGGIWVFSWEEASHVQDLWENIPATARHSLRLLTCQKWEEKGKQESHLLSRHVSPQSKRLSRHVSEIKRGLLE